MSADNEAPQTQDANDQNICANLQCRTTCDDETFCSGCQFFVCNDCDINQPTGSHDVMAHWNENDE